MQRLVIDFKVIYYHGQIYDPPFHREEPPASDEPEHSALRQRHGAQKGSQVIDFGFSHPLLLESERIQYGVDEALPQAAVVVKYQEQKNDI